MPAIKIKSGSKRDALKVQLVGDSAELRAPAKESLGALPDPPLEILESEAAGPRTSGAALPDVTMVLFNGDEHSALATLQNIAAQSPRPTLVALLSARTPGLMKRALRAGADELLFLPLDAGDLTRALLKVTETRWRSQRREGGIVCSLLSIVGGVGVTSLAANLGIALQEVLHKRVALVDLDLQTGELAVQLNLEPEVTMLPLIRLDRRLDSIQLESALTKHPSGLYLLAAPKRIEEGDLISDVTVGTVIDLLKQLFDYVIIDCGDHIDENAVAAWEHSSRVLYLLEQSVTAVRSAWRFIDLFERIGLHGLEPEFVLNRARASHPITAKQIETTLGRPLLAQVPADGPLMERVAMSGKHLWQHAPRSNLAHSIVHLARALTPVSERELQSESAGLVARVRSLLGRRETPAVLATGSTE